MAPPDNAVAIDWHRYSACGLCAIADGLTLAFVPVKAFLQHYLPALGGESWRRGRPLAITADDFARPLLAASEIARVNTFKSLKRQTEWMAGRLAAKTLGQLLAEDEPAITDLRVAHDRQGAPYLERRPELSLSISHAHDYAVAGLHQHTDTVIGLDLEKHQPLDIALMLRTAFSAREGRHLDPADRPRFFACWTLKEAYLKYLGRGFRESLKQIEILDDTRIVDHGKPVAGLSVRVLQPFPQYTLAIVCGPRPSTLQVPAET
jgi:4'-phosphopantetheinyl transferase